ncbi:hypothetical protein WAF17_01985 [Bernardetia sp. ABR2-2B]|uniref:hypothetical protein n=1 Tax=Bernardetia sp. ABR2-2B TaxID=3127472 RepID=UPI0030CCCFAD
MNKKLFLFFLAFFSYQFVIGQDDRDFASTLNYFSNGDNVTSNQICSGNEVKHREIISEIYGKEYYCNGNIHAEGEIKKLKSQTVIYPNEGNKKMLMTEYVRNGNWRVYFDSTLKVLRSEGSYKDGEKNGKWIIYSKLGNVLYEFDYLEGQLKSKVVVQQNGIRQTVFHRSHANLFVKRNEILLILIGILPIVLFRIGWNILTYNQINNTNYIPLFQNWQEGGFFVNIYCTFTFWWLIKKEDNKSIRKYKYIGNWISVLSIICFASVMIIFSLYGINIK